MYQGPRVQVYQQCGDQHNPTTTSVGVGQNPQATTRYPCTRVPVYQQGDDQHNLTTTTAVCDQHTTAGTSFGGHQYTKISSWYAGHQKNQASQGFFLRADIVEQLYTKVPQFIKHTFKWRKKFFQVNYVIYLWVHFV